MPLAEHFVVHAAALTEEKVIPLFSTRVPAGFPSPAEDHIEQSLNLNDLVIKHPAATFFVKVDGDSMREAGIHSGDILVVDRSLKATSGKIILAILNGEFTVKRLEKTETDLWLHPANPSFKSVRVTEEMDFQVWGVVTYVIHRTC